MAAAALRILFRRHSGVPAFPSVAMPGPLFPGPYSKLRSPLPPAAAAVAGLPGVYHSQASPSLVPYLLRHYSSKAVTTASLPDMCIVPPSPPQRLSLMICHYSSKQRGMSPLQSATASPLVSRHSQSSWYPVPYLFRHYSSKRFVPLPPLRRIDHEETQNLKQGGQRCNTDMYTEAELMMWFLEVVVKDMEEQYAVMKKALTICEKGMDAKDFSVMEEGLYDFSCALAVLEKGLDDCEKATARCDGLPLDVLEKNRKFCKESEQFLMNIRPRIRKLLSDLSGTKRLWEVTKMMAISLAVGTGIPLIHMASLSG